MNRDFSFRDHPTRVSSEARGREFVGRGRERTQLRESRVRDPRTGLNGDQRAAIRDVGTFRTVDVGALDLYVYHGRRGDMRNDLKALEQARMIRIHTARKSNGGELEFVTITRKAQKWLNEYDVTGQQFHAGLAHPANIWHDVGVYRAYQEESLRIRMNGGKVNRVVLDFELQKIAYAKMQMGDSRENAADAVHLPIANGHIVFPDARIEYTDAHGEPCRVNLEVKTANYRRADVDEKAGAGFVMYEQNCTTHGVVRDPHIVSELIGL